MSIKEDYDKLNERLKVLENRFSELGYDMRGLVASEIKKKWRIEPQMNQMFGLTVAMCVDTIDPWKQNRIRFYSPLLHDPNTPVKSLDNMAMPVSSMGGFDDCGLNWVPPAGSTVIIAHEQGARNSPFYLGTTWTRNRGPVGAHNFGYPIQEYYDIHKGHRKGYNVGPNDESQVFPPWNTENYNSYDIDSQTEFDNDPDAYKKVTYPHIYGHKTPQKHMIKHVDGNYRCNHRWKRSEWQSSCGNYLILKDDHLHPGGQWAHPSCGCGGGDESNCADGPLNEDCAHPESMPKCANPFFKHANECRPVMGPRTPQNNKLDLNQSGIQFLSISGHTMVMDDSVEEPQGVPNWERSLEAFDFGCTDKYTGKFYIKSCTGHLFEMSDVESDSQLRGDKNYIKLLTACGNRIELNDHTVGEKDCPGCPPNLAGEKRGITMESTSKHIIRMIDEDNEQCSPCRMEGGLPVNKAKNAYIQVRTGYGLQMIFRDDNSQEETQKQYIEIRAPQKDNQERGPHIELFKEAPSGPGLVFLRVGGNYVIQTYDNMWDIIGDPDKNPSNKYTSVSQHYVIETKKLHYHIADQHIFAAHKQILLIGECDRQDCGPDENGNKGPCIYQVVINRCPEYCAVGGKWHYQPGKSTSESVFASGRSGCG
jgi:hypothetical protein